MAKHRFYESMNKLFVLNYSIIILFCLVEIGIGISFLNFNLINPRFLKVLTVFMPIYLWAFLFIFGGMAGFFIKQQSLYMFFTSLPLLLYSSILYRSVIEGTGASLSGAWTYLILGIFSIYYGIKEIPKWI